MESLKMVDNIMEQKTHDYTDNLRLLKPNYVVHGDDWIDGQSVIRKKVIEVLSEFDGELIEVPYTGGISTTDIINKIKNIN
jgi:phosphoenolpyruvate phosphomutase